MGLGCSGKKREVEMKIEGVDRALCRRLWGNDDFNWIVKIDRVIRRRYFLHLGQVELGDGVPQMVHRALADCYGE
ncbi:hypothetical protein Ancab_005655 [Ancistrocladus abbreviatus]